MTQKQNIRETLHEIIFEADTPAGKMFDILLLWSIVLSVLAVILETVQSIQVQYGETLRVVEWFFTVLFTIEYILRTLCVKRPLHYILSFYGIIDLFSILPTYVSLFFAGTHYLMVIRAVRLLRIFRVLKLARYLGEAEELTNALHASRHKITVFLGAVFTIVVIVGTLLYVIEGEESGYTSIPKGIYWAVVTLTTVGYGDITPQTPIGQALSAMVMILGYGVLAVPTGIVSAELSKASHEPHRPISTKACRGCGCQGHDTDADFCKYCGNTLRDR